MRPATALTIASAVAAAAVPQLVHAEQVCGTVDEFNAAMAAAGTSSTDVTVVFDVVGVNPNDFPATKGSLAQMRNTICGTGQDAGIKVYGPDDPPNRAHPTGTLKMEYGNTCCGGTCGENWAEPNASLPVFADGSETCTVTMWMKPAEAGYTLDCNVGLFEGLGGNPEGNTVNEIALLTFLLPDGGSTWTIDNATATNDEVCWESVPSDAQSITVPVREDVSASPGFADAVFPDVTDLAVEAADAEAYLKFDVPVIEGKITSARLFMKTSTAPSSDGDGGEVHVLLATDWSEATMTWNTRPAYEAASLGRIGPAAADVLLSLDLGEAVVDGSTWGVAVVSPPTDGNGTHFWSKEGSPADAAYLQIDYVVMDGDGDGVPDGPDCDDANVDVGPDAQEVCNAIDDDCDGDVDEACDGADDSGSGGLGSASSGGDGPGSGSGTGEDTLPVPGGVDRGAEPGCACSSTTPHEWTWSGLWLGLWLVPLLRRRRAS